MYRREQDRGRRPPKRDRSPDERDRSPRDDKRRRSQTNERNHEGSLSPRTTRSSTTQNGRDERRHRRDELRERDAPPPSRSRPQGYYDCDYEDSKWVDVSSRSGRDKKSININMNSKSEVDNKHVDRRPPPPPTKQQTQPPTNTTTNHAPSKTKVIISNILLEEDDPPLSSVMGFSRFSSTKGKKHVDYGTVDPIKKRTYRQYMNRPGGFNRPIAGGS
jgi:U4/U6.U5 tri-snRNP-associated protein 3